MRLLADLMYRVMMETPLQTLSPCLIEDSPYLEERIRFRIWVGSVLSFLPTFLIDSMGAILCGFLNLESTFFSICSLCIT